MNWWSREHGDGSKLEAVISRVFGADDDGMRYAEIVRKTVNEIRDDEEERRRRWEVARAAEGGVNARVMRVDGDRAFLPPDLERVYGLLCGEALVQPAAAYVGDPIEKAKGRMVTRTSTGQTETRGGAKGSRKSGGSKDFIRSIAAFNYKTKVDRKLRKLTREIKTWLQGSGEYRDDVRRCTVCRKFGEPEWLYCPQDGKPMESV